MKKTGFFIAGMMLAFHASANIIDLYGVDTKKSSEMIRKYGDAVNKIEIQFMEEYLKLKHHTQNEKESEAFFEKRMNLMEKIKKENHLLFVDFQTISYSNKKDRYTTIEVIDEKDPERLQYVDAIRKAGPDTQAKGDIIDEMTTYTNIVMEQMLQNKFPRKAACPVYHCAGEFESPQFKPYLAKFNEAAIRQKKLILDTLNHDPDPERRASAAFLMGHFSNPREIISELLPHVGDKESGVRNNVIRVIAETMNRAKIYQIDVKPFLALLDSPYTSDRNKALAVLLSASQSNASKAQIIQQGRDKLLNILALKQPNNHDIAYELLKKISNKDFGEMNINAWKKWAKAVG